MGNTLETMKVVIEAAIGPYKKALKDAQNETKKTVDSINKDTGKIKNPLSKALGGDSMQEVRNMQKLIKQSIVDMKSGVLPKNMLDGVKNYTKKAQLNAGVKEYTGEYRQYLTDMERVEKELDKLEQKQRDMDASGISHQSEEWKNVSNQIDTAKRKAESYTGSMRRLEGTGKDVQLAGVGNFRSGSYLEAAGAVASQVKSDVVQKMRGIKESVAEVVKRIPVIGRVSREAAYLGSKAFGGLKSVFDKISPAIKKTGGAAASLIQRFASGIPGIRRFSSSMNRAGSAGRKFGGILQTLGMTARFMFASFILRGALIGAKQGFQNLAQYSSQTNASLSMLMSSLTQLKNSLATAFAPVMNVVAPILNALIQKVSQAVSAVGMLFAALTGQKSFTKAKKVQQDYAASLNQNASGANKANEANKKLQRTLLGFDQINKMEDNSSSDTDSNSGSGGLLPEDMFEDVTVSDKIKEFSNKIKEAWKNADFTEIGQIVGNKVNEALAGIPWNKIKDTSRKIAKSIVTFLNGFLEATDWNLVGKTVAEGINTCLEFLYTAVTEFDWKRFGKALADTINGVFKNFDWAKLGKTLSSGIVGVLDSILVAIRNIDWEQIGTSIGAFIKNIDWKNIISKALNVLLSLPFILFDIISGVIKEVDWKKLVKDIASGIKKALEDFDWKGAFKSAGKIIGVAFKLLFNLGELIGEAVSESITKAKEYFQEKIEECGGSIVEGIFKGIKDAIKSIGKWIKENIFQPFIDGFKDAFGIHSPSTVMAEQGKYIIDGLKKGLLDNIKSVINWVKKLPKKIKEALGNAKEWLVQKGKDAIEGLRSGWESVKESRLGRTVSQVGNFVKLKAGDATRWVKQKGKDAIEGLKSGWESAKNGTLLSKVSRIGSEVVSRIGNIAGMTRPKGTDVVRGMQSGITGNIGMLTGLTGSIPNKIVSSIGNINYRMFTVGKSVSEGLRNGIQNSVPSLTRIVQLIPNQIRNSLGNLYSVGHNAIAGLAEGFRSIYIPTPHFSVESKRYWIGSKSFSIPRISLQWYAAGGFPTNGEMFIAREAGPELVGRMGRKNAVANNQQIIEGIKAGVFEAVMDAFSASGFFGGSSREKSVVLEFTLMCDSETIYRMSKKGEQKYEDRFTVIQPI